MNVLFEDTGSIEWKRGWPLRSGQLATLCDKCGFAFEQAMFCDVSHSKDFRWRECASCGKAWKLHEKGELMILVDTSLGGEHDK
ncbi:hypothetical protein BT93_E0640 [Corymbia citriodora subsp. variegata]|nr:hypothetical protein BT93_E0640 [Corymbia citriodora subsp. variegata]